ncbi:hypothetical protein [Pseudomonas savastanoi]|uniref:hypothetical protein n=1 Tax=Pseudomonas savastanoi TaxID=29438 RepID=UPI000A518080|nr:hypothetical protein [Pseudomonas savastanoi]
MAMKFGRAHCEELKKLLSPYQARDLYTNEDGEHYAQSLRGSALPRTTHPRRYIHGAQIKTGAALSH